MATDTFDAALKTILGFEGGYVDDPADPGGATNLGVTLHTWEAYVGRAVTKDQLRALTPQDVGPLYRTRYWDVAHCDDWPAGVDLIVFDEAVNQGPGAAARTLQQAAGVAADGSIGPATRAAVAAAAVGPLIDAISTLREARYRSLPTFERFGRGWMNRLATVTADAHRLGG